MSKSGENDDKFLQRAKSLFDGSVEGLDGSTQSRLNQGRHRALEAAGRDKASYGRWMQWVPATAAVAVVAVALFAWNGVQVPVPTAAPVSDFEIVMTDDSFEMLEELDFYSWLDMEGEFVPEANADANVG